MSQRKRRTVKQHPLALLRRLLRPKRSQHQRVLALNSLDERRVGPELLERVLEVDGRLAAVFTVVVLRDSRERDQLREHVQEDVCEGSSEAKDIGSAMRVAQRVSKKEERADSPSFFSHPHPL